MSNQNEVQVKEKATMKEFVDNVQDQFNEMNKEDNITLPPNYSVGNAVKSAYLQLQETKDRNKKPVLEVCSRTSVANSLLEMVVQGLSPAKNQCYFIAYGTSLQLMRSYMGTVAVTKRLNGIKDVKAYCIYEGDEFETEFDVNTAILNITKFNPDFENIDITKIRGAFAVIVGDHGPLHTEIMNFKQIKAAWGQGATKGNSGAHKNFAEEMAKKTVINRACKMYANTSDDSDLLLGAFNRTTENEHKEDEVEEEIEQKANSQELDFETKKESTKVEKPKEDIIDAEYEEVKEEQINGQMKLDPEDEVPY